jgi:hypothetical protein
MVGEGPPSTPYDVDIAEVMDGRPPPTMTESGEFPAH